MKLNELFLLLWIMISITGLGMAVVHRFCRWRGLALIGYGAAGGVLLHGFLGFFLALAPSLRPLLLAGGALLLLGALVYLLRSGALRELRRDLSVPARWFLLIWVAFNLGCIGLTHVGLTWPRSLPDGLYPFKQHTTNVKIQVLCHLPADNLIPYAVSEYLLRDIPFAEVHPILPAQEVTNRTVLMSLVDVAFRSAFSNPVWQGPFPHFFYLGESRPDAMALYSAKRFERFLVIAIFLNSLLLLGLGVLFRRLARGPALPVAALLFAFSPYLVSQTIFTWPKSLAAFFVVLAWDCLRSRRQPVLTGLLLALAFWAHPFALAFILGAGLWYLLQALWRKAAWRDPALFAGSTALLLAPWYVWTRLILPLPTSMLRQNLNNYEPLSLEPSALFEFFWARVHNLYHLLDPRFLSGIPFDLGRFCGGILYTLPGAVGLFLILPAFLTAARLRPRLLWLCAAVAPGAIILAAFGYEMIVIVHGFQGVVAALLFLGVRHLLVSRRLFWTVAVLQLALHLVSFYALAVRADVRF